MVSVPEYRTEGPGFFSRPGKLRVSLISLQQCGYGGPYPWVHHPSVGMLNPNEDGRGRICPHPVRRLITLKKLFSEEKKISIPPIGS